MGDEDGRRGREALSAECGSPAAADEVVSAFPY